MDDGGACRLPLQLPRLLPFLLRMLGERWLWTGVVVPLWGSYSLLRLRRSASHDMDMASMFCE